MLLVCMYVYMYVCICISVSICMSISMCIYVYRRIRLCRLDLPERATVAKNSMGIVRDVSEVTSNMVTIIAGMVP